MLEVEHLIRALKAEGKDFEYEIYEDVPGGHSFDRLDGREAKEIRVKVYQFLAKYLDPDHPIFEDFGDAPSSPIVGDIVGEDGEHLGSGHQ